VVPEVFESGWALVSVVGVKVVVCTYSSVAFISGQDCGEQNSVMAP